MGEGWEKVAQRLGEKHVEVGTKLRKGWKKIDKELGDDWEKTNLKLLL